MNVSLRAKIKNILLTYWEICSFLVESNVTKIHKKELILEL